MKALIIVLLAVFAMNTKAESVSFDHNASVVCSAGAIVAHSRELITKDQYEILVLGFIHYYEGTKDEFVREASLFAHNSLRDDTDENLILILTGCEHTWVAQRQLDEAS